MHDRPLPLFLCLAIGACTADATPTEPRRNLAHDHDVPTLASMQPAEDQETASVPEIDPYAGAERWCEPLSYDQTCKDHSDCADIEHVAQRPLRCFHTKMAHRDGLQDEHGNPLKFCAPGQTGPVELEWRRARLRDLVGQLYFDEPGRCPAWSWDLRGKGHNARFVQQWEDGRPLHQQHYRCQREWKAAEHLAAFLWVPYKRETTARPWARHRLDADQHANEQSWVREASAYGWVIDLACSNGKKRCKNDKLVVADFHPDPAAEHSNPFYGDRYRWQFGLGGFGKNTGYGVQDWDLAAPPEILCLEVPGTESYLRDARHAVDVFRGGGVSCGDATYRGLALRVLEDGSAQVVEEPSWIDVHRVASAGKFCPRVDGTGRKYEAMFRKRMEFEGLRPDEPVTREMLGRAIPRETQNEQAMQALARLDAVLPPPWDVPRETSDVVADVAPGTASSP